MRTHKHTSSSTPTVSLSTSQGCYVAICASCPLVGSAWFSLSHRKRVMLIINTRSHAGTRPIVFRTGFCLSSLGAADRRGCPSQTLSMATPHLYTYSPSSYVFVIFFPFSLFPSFPSLSLSLVSGTLMDIDLLYFGSLSPTVLDFATLRHGGTDGDLNRQCLGGTRCGCQLTSQYKYYVRQCGCSKLVAIPSLRPIFGSPLVSSTNTDTDPATVTVQPWPTRSKTPSVRKTKKAK